MNNIRLERIRQFIETNQVVTIKQLQELCPEVSLMTIHRDLDILEECADVVKIRGGARSVRHTSDLGFDVRLRENVGAKHAIAHKALALIQPGTSLFLDASTTNLMLARALPDVDLNIFTTGPYIAIELCRLHNANITVCCGMMNRKNMALSGQNTLQMLDGINIDLAFIGVSGCSAEAGFTCGTEGDMVVKRRLIQKARTTALMCDSEKFSRLMPYTFARFSDVDYLISEKVVPDSIAAAAKNASVILL